MNPALTQQPRQKNPPRPHPKPIQPITQSALSTLRLPATGECQGLPLYRAVFGVQSLHQDQLGGLPAGCLQYVILVESYIMLHLWIPKFQSQQSLIHDALGFRNSI